MRTAVAMLLTNSVLFFYFIGFSSQSSVDIEASSTGTKSPGALSSGTKSPGALSTRTKSLGALSSGTKSLGAFSSESKHLRASSSESKRLRVSSPGSKRSLSSSSGSKRSLADSTLPQLSPEINRKGLHIPNGVEVWWEGDKIIALEENDVYEPFLFFAEFAIVQAVRNKKDPSKIGFNVVVLSCQEWLEYMAEYSAYKKRPSILYSARATAMKLTKARREAIEELRKEREREAAFKELYIYDKGQGWHGVPENQKPQ